MPSDGWSSMRDCFNRLEDSSSYSASVLQTNVAKNTSSIAKRGIEKKSNAICITAIMSSTLWQPLYPFFSYCFTLYRLEVIPRCCNNLLYIYPYILPLPNIQSKTNDSTSSGSSRQCSIPLRHCCMILFLVLLTFDAPSSDYLAKWLTHLLVKPTE